ncbi:toll/interleukin-1 receptor domain-containing protein [Aeromonas sp. sif0611]|uniref:toll/interleukin-1 receptor domain-containing protein n=1 Tax=Aeromonas sp. sif0611 TaxID=2854787 RepID=UPI001C471D00|nr:toll/interleukin-1 receptor domain-containing protein [Aeromonas sp. sif0611]MBV7470975.1 toll/interleukin-1 receptor domain-containing protein [Aeromonas sp. sif0611]
MDSNKIPSALISYSWDSEEHKVWVRGIAQRLRRNGVDVKLDQWHVKPGQSLTQFMEREIVECDHVIIICTPNYYEKSLSRKGGVSYEQQIISGHIASGVPREKFIPVVREGNFEPGNNCSIPPHFSGIFAVDMRNQDSIDGSIELLLRSIFNEPLHAIPEIGERPIWDVQEQTNFSELRLPTIDLDGYELRSGLAQHHRTPETFYMPREDERQTLNVGDIVKLIFIIAVTADPEDPDDDGTFGERMWVIVKGRIGPYYIGNLNNMPLTSGEQDNLTFEDEVIFLPEHVIDIQKASRFD